MAMRRSLRPSLYPSACLHSILELNVLALLAGLRLLAQGRRKSLFPREMAYLIGQ